MSKIKDMEMRLEESDLEPTDENIGMLLELDADKEELEAYRNSIEGQLAGYTTEQLQSELCRRYNEPMMSALRRMGELADSMVRATEGL